MEIQTSRLYLREFTEYDWPAVLAYQTDPLYLRYYPWTTRTFGDVQAFVNQFVHWQTETPRTKFQVAVVLAETDRLIGNCGLRTKQPGATEADLGYEIAPAYWGRGYATEAAQELLTFGFDKLGLHRIWASVIAENRGSIRVLEKLGMQREGRLRESQWMKERWWDTLIYAILADEWRS